MSDDKTEEPTEKKLQDAREQGQVARSADLTYALTLTAAFLFLVGGAGTVMEHLRAIMLVALERILLISIQK